MAFTYTYEDYDIFIQGKMLITTENMKKLRINLKLFWTVIPFSYLKNNYAFYFIGMTYYRMGDWKKAVFYLEKLFSAINFLFNRGSEIEKYLLCWKRLLLGDALIKTEIKLD